jgi:hypothetical protein
MTILNPEDINAEFNAELNDDEEDFEVTAGTEYAKLTEKPTSSTNPEKPRTHAAGYNKKLNLMTVVFRDGTWWNYYDVPLSIWEGFKSADSKGVYLRLSGLDHWPNMGPVEMGALTNAQRTTLNTVAKDAARMQKTFYGRQGQGETRGKFTNPALAKLNKALGQNVIINQHSGLTGWE